MGTPKTTEGPTLELAKNRPSLPSNELQQLWFATLRHPWSSLVVIPAHPGGESLLVARALAEVGGLHRANPIKLISAEGMDMSSTSRLIIEMTTHVASGGLVIISLDSVISNPTGIPVAMAADSALLCIELGSADFGSAQKTIDLIGASRFMGTVTLQGGRP